MSDTTPKPFRLVKEPDGKLTWEDPAESELAERSGVLQGCPTSATGCPEARADGLPKADSSGRCPEVNGPALAQLAHKWLEEAKRRRADVAAEEKLGWKGGAASIGYCECLEDKAAELLRIKPDAPQRSGERVLPDNE